MVQNLKVDIIYHLTASDFEMEFNLCGCCRMRLLSDKTADKKSFVRALARNVARSRVIIACGPLFGADGLIAMVATAIGNSLAPCDNKTYGINGDETIHIINGSTPLVTPDGYFGGCIIESGPQTIILLTENKAFRKSIMQNLIHPYIEEISYIPTKIGPLPTPATEVDPVFDTSINEAEICLTEPDEYDHKLESAADEPAPVVQNEHNIEFIMDDEDSDNADPADDSSQFINPTSVLDDNYNLMYAEVEKSSDIKSHYSELYVPSESDDMFISTSQLDEEDVRSKNKAPTRAMDIAIVILVLLLLLSILALAYLVVLRPMSMGVSTGEYIKEIFGLASSNTLV